MTADPVRQPAHYTMYPLEVIQITRHLDFCLGNAVKYMLRAPWKGGVEDCDKALQYLSWTEDADSILMRPRHYLSFDIAVNRLTDWFYNAGGDQLWDDIAHILAAFLQELQGFVEGDSARVQPMKELASELGRILALRDTTGQIYEGMSGLPKKEEE